MSPQVSTLPSLYDEPGPRARARIRIASIVSGLTLAGLAGLGLAQFAAHGQFAANKWQPFAIWETWSFLLVGGLLGTLQAAALTIAGSLPFGILLALGRSGRNRVLRVVCSAYVEVGRTVPALLLVYLMLFGLPQVGINLPLLWKLVVPLTIANSAAFAEIVRAGILGLPNGQREAALSLGMTDAQASRLVVLPQALRFALPALVTQLVSVVKDTSLGFVVAFMELLYRGQVLAAYDRNLIQTYIVVTGIYLVVNGSLSALASRLRSHPVRGGEGLSAAPEIAGASAM